MAAPKILVAFAKKSHYNINMKSQWIILGYSLYAKSRQWWWGPYKTKKDAKKVTCDYMKGIVVEVKTDQDLNNYISERMSD